MMRKMFRWCPGSRQDTKKSQGQRAHVQEGQKQGLSLYIYEKLHDKGEKKSNEPSKRYPSDSAQVHSIPCHGWNEPVTGNTWPTRTLRLNL